jgi:hypothetical protein
MAETVLWIDPDGGVLYLDVDWNVHGRFAPSYTFEVEKVAGRDGQRLRAVRPDVLEFDLPCWVVGNTDAELRTLMRDFVARMDPTRGDGTIRFIEPGGTTRDIVCRVVSGLGIDEVLGGESGILSQRITPTFRAWEPYWTDPADTVITYSGGGVVATFFPFFPVALSASEAIAAGTVTNPGATDTWPVWTITGPATDVTITNHTTDQEFTINFSPSLTYPQAVTIDTRPGAKTVLRENGTSLFSQLAWSSVLWPLIRGANDITVAMGGTTAQSSVSLAFRPRYGSV